MSAPCSGATSAAGDTRTHVYKLYAGTSQSYYYAYITYVSRARAFSVHAQNIRSVALEYLRALRAFDGRYMIYTACTRTHARVSAVNKQLFEKGAK